MNLRLMIILVLAGLLGVASAAEQQTPVPVTGSAAKADKSQPQAPAQPTADNTQSNSKVTAEQAAKTKSQAEQKASAESQRFIPSESISEDLSVSFPVDI